MRRQGQARVVDVGRRLGTKRLETLPRLLPVQNKLLRSLWLSRDSAEATGCASSLTVRRTQLHTLAAVRYMKRKQLMEAHMICREPFRRSGGWLHHTCGLNAANRGLLLTELLPFFAVN